MFDEEITGLAEQVVTLAIEQNVMIATVESCTGGLIAGALTEISGSSAVVDRGFVTYSNDAKQELVGVPAETLELYGAVSSETAMAMARGGLERSRAHMTVSVTGIAGPTGGSDDKPVGLVWFGLAGSDFPAGAREKRFGNPGRAGIRRETVHTALSWLLEKLTQVKSI